MRVAAMETNPLNQHEQVGEPSPYSCPECGGVLWETHDGALMRFRCRTGHAFSVESVLAEQYEQIEQALWVALKTLDENASLSRRMAKQAQQNGHAWLAERLEAKVREAEQKELMDANEELQVANEELVLTHRDNARGIFLTRLFHLITSLDASMA